MFSKIEEDELIFSSAIVLFFPPLYCLNDSSFSGLWVGNRTGNHG